MQTKDSKMVQYVLICTLLAGVSFISGYAAGNKAEDIPDTSDLEEKIDELKSEISDWREISEIQAEQIESDIQEKNILQAVIKDLIKENKELKN
jgi:hypothetical protein